MVKTGHSSIKDIHQLLTENAASAEINLDGCQNGYLGLKFTPKKYAHISDTPFILLPNPVITETVPAWTLTG